MDFVEWLLTKQIRKDTPVGDLARDVKADRCLPPTAHTPEAVLLHIQAQHRACQGAALAMRDARKLWKAACRSSHVIPAERS
jgi:hypothetical protein